MSEDPTEVSDAMEMLGTGYDQVRVRDESNDRRYFTITPRIVKAYARNPHDLALWETVKDIAGESGECFLNTDQLAVLSGMSTGQVSSSRKYWLKIGFLKGEQRRDPGYIQAVWHLSVPDLWAKNIAWCEKYPKIEDRLEFRKAHRSLHRVKASPSEGKPSGSETKKILIKKINDDDLRASLEMSLMERIALFSSLYESNIGPLTPLIADRIQDEVVDYPDTSWYAPAMTIAVENNARHINYVLKILQGWKEHYFGWKPDFQEKKKGVKHDKKRKTNNSGNEQGGLSPEDQRTADAINKRRAAKKAAMSSVQ